MIPIAIAVMVSFACGFWAGVAYRRRARSKVKLPMKMILRMENDEDPLVEFLARERRFLRLIGYGD